MNKKELRSKVLEYGDAIVTYRSENSKKLKYNVLTLDFDTKYVRSKKNKSVEDVNTLLFFCWDTDSFRLIKPASVISVVPLSAVLRN
jgi:uncharacterized membrane protein YqiK